MMSAQPNRRLFGNLRATLLYAQCLGGSLAQPTLITTISKLRCILKEGHQESPSCVTKELLSRSPNRCECPRTNDAWHRSAASSYTFSRPISAIPDILNQKCTPA